MINAEWIEEAGYPKAVSVECPCCGAIEQAKVHFYKGDPFPSYGHKCFQCGYEIDESEWNEKEENT